MLERLLSPFKSKPNHDLVPSVPQSLDVEVSLRNELRQSAQAGEWGTLLEQLKSLKSRTSVLGSVSVASIVNAVSYQGAPSLLHLVAGREHSTELTKILLKLGADPNAVCWEASMNLQAHVFDRPTPIFWAISQGDRGACRALLRGGASVLHFNRMGETPLQFLTRMGLRAPPWRTIQSDLLKAGADPSTPNHKGMSPFAYSILTSSWEDARLFTEHGAQLSRSSRQLVREVVNHLIRRAEDAFRREQETEELLRYFFKDLELLKPALGFREVGAILNTPTRAGDGLSVFGRMVLAGMPAELVLRAMQMGASVSRQYAINLSIHIKDVSALHLAILSGNPRLVSLILQAGGGSDLHRFVGEQQLPPLHFMYLNGRPSLEIAGILLKWGADPLAKSGDGKSLFDRAVSCRDIPGMMMWAEYETNPFARATPVVQQIGLYDDQIQEQKAELIRFGKIRAQLSGPAEQEMIAYASSGSPESEERRSREYLHAYQVATTPGMWHQKNEELLKIIPRILLSEKPTGLTELIASVERLFDHNEDVRGFHPFESELMALVAHPSRNQERLELVRTTVLALTSINRFLNTNIFSVPASTVSLWGRIGVLGLSFRRWKWDTQGVVLGDSRAESLYEKFGFEPLPTQSLLSSPFGSGFSLSHRRKEMIGRQARSRDAQSVFDADTYIEHRHGYLLASHPIAGTLIVRNSSPVFGRDVLAHPAYYSRFAPGQGFAKDEFSVLTVLGIEGGFTPILHPSLYEAHSSTVGNIEVLLSHLEEVATSYGSWKFDTHPVTAWERMEGVGVFMQGGYFSEGYSTLVQTLRKMVTRAMQNEDPYPELAFFDTGLPPWAPIKFTDMDGREFSTLELKPTAVRLLEKLGTSSATKEDFSTDNGRAYHFFQAGLDRGAELVILDGKGK
jgi:ankyrin repeat protein